METARDLRKAGLQLARDERCARWCCAATAACSAAAPTSSTSAPAGPPTTWATSSRAARRAQPGYGAIFKEILEYLHSTISEIRRAPKPVIAAVDGAAAAGGLGLAMACDLVIASERATFEWAYFKTGLSGAESTTFLLPRLVGLRKALELAMLNPRLTARDAHGIGLVTAVHADPLIDAEARALAHRLAAGPTEAMAVAKNLMNAAAGMDRLDVHLDRELEELTRIADGADFAEGLDAFFARRPAAFSGGG